MPFMKSKISSLFSGFKSSIIASNNSFVISWADLILSRLLPGSPWIPTPNSISSAPNSKVGLPAAGTVQLEKATPIDPEFVLTLSPKALHSWREPPLSAKDPTIFSTKTVAATPLRPVVNEESSTATSSLVKTDALGPDIISAAISKFITSPE